MGSLGFGISIRERYGDPDQTPQTLNEEKLKLSQFADRGVDHFAYKYDLLDDWRHTIMVEGTLPADPGVRYPRCIAGERHCPPEDCGGPSGYVEFLAAIQDRDHEKHEQLRQWFGEDFVPEAFDQEAANDEFGEEQERGRRYFHALMVTYQGKVNPLYADVAEAGGLARALQAEMKRIGSSLRVERGMSLFPLSGTSVNQNRRCCQISLALERRLSLFDFWDRGVMLAGAGTLLLPKVAEAIDAWIARGVNTDELRRRFDFVSVEEGAKLHEQGAEAEVEWRWQSLYEWFRREENDKRELFPLIEKAMEVPVLRRLFPVTSHDWLCFSRCPIAMPLRWSSNHSMSQPI